MRCRCFIVSLVKQNESLVANDGLGEGGKEEDKEIYFFILKILFKCKLLENQ